MNSLTKILFFSLVASINAYSQSTVSTPIVGFVSTSALPASDTIVSPQILRPSEFSSSVSAVTISPDQITADLTLSTSSLINDQFKYVVSTQPKTYFALVKSGTLAGSYFTVVSNTSSSITVNLDGLTPSSSDILSIEVRPFWTLNTLFPPSAANVSFVPSTGTTTAGRRTQLLLPDNISTGQNRSLSSVYFYNPTLADWVLTTATNVRAGDRIVEPSGYLVLRNTGGTPPTLSVTTAGAVLTDPVGIYLATSSTRINDNYLTLPRASNYKLSEMGFTDSNFVQSTSKTTGGRRDTVLIIDQTGSGLNRAPSKVYFRFGNAWYDTTATANPVDPVIPAGSAIIVRKVVSDGFDKLVNNTSNLTP